MFSPTWPHSREAAPQAPGRQPPSVPLLFLASLGARFSPGAGGDGRQDAPPAPRAARPEPAHRGRLRHPVATCRIGGGAPGESKVSRRALAAAGLCREQRREKAKETVGWQVERIPPKRLVDSRPHEVNSVRRARLSAGSLSSLVCYIPGSPGFFVHKRIFDWGLRLLSPEILTSWHCSGLMRRQR